MSNIRPTDADTVDGQDADELSKSDADIQAAVDGSNVSVAEADAVDGQDASELSGSLSVASPNEVSGSRSVNTQFSNLTGNPLVVYITTGKQNDGTGTMDVDFQRVQRLESFSEIISGTMIVPPGSTYAFDTFSNLKVGEWYEQEVSIQ